MKKLIFATLLMLTVFTGRSQDTTLDDRPLPPFPFWMATEIAVDLNRLDRVESLNFLYGEMVENLKDQVATLTAKTLNLEDQISLLLSTNQILKAQLEAERAKDPKAGFWKLAWRGIVAAAIGFVVGSLSR